MPSAEIGAPSRPSRHGRPPQFRQRSVAPLCHGTPRRRAADALFSQQQQSRDDLAGEGRRPMAVSVHGPATFALQQFRPESRGQLTFG